MDCKQVQILLAPYILGDLDNDPFHYSQLHAHLRGCSECTEMYEGFEETIGFVLEHKAEFAQAFKKARARDEEDAAQAESSAKLASNRGLFVKISAIAACLILGLGLFFVANQFKKAWNDFFHIASNQQETSVKIELLTGSGSEIIPTGRLITAVNSLKTLRINGNRQMVLNTGTKLSIEPYHLGCVVKLDKGEIYTEVEHDGRPFMVETPHGRAVITGTTFNIKADHDKMELAVIEGSVRFESENGAVDVPGGYRSSIAASMQPTTPVVCNIAIVPQWAKEKEINATIQANQLDSHFSQILELPAIFISYRDLEKIDFEIWINEHRSWFEREFPWTKRIQNILSENGIEVDTIDLLIESGDLWRFGWPEYSQQRILVENRENIQEIAARYNVKIDKLISGEILVQTEHSSGIEALERWYKEFDINEGNVTIASIHAAKFFIKTRSLAWYALNSNYVQLQEKQQVLDLLKEQVKIASNMLGVLNQMFLVDKNKSACSVVQYDDHIEKIDDSISAMIVAEKDLMRYEIVGG